MEVKAAAIKEARQLAFAYTRQLKPRQRTEVKAVREKKGVQAAIKSARKLVRR